MAQQPASTLGFIREGLVDEKGQPKRGFLKYLQQVTTAVSYLTPLGIKPTAPIVGASKTIGGATSNLSATGTLPSASLTGSITGPQVGFTLDEVPDGTKRFAVVNAGSLNGVALVDSANLALINFADTAHQNKILDNVNDGVTYQALHESSFRGYDASNHVDKLRKLQYKLGNCYRHSANGHYPLESWRGTSVRLWLSVRWVALHLGLCDSQCGQLLCWEQLSRTSCPWGTSN